MTTDHNQWIRKVQLSVYNPGKAGNNPSAFTSGALDLSQFRIRFETSSADFESPNPCSIRVYNLSAKTINQVRGEFSEVALSAGYGNGNYGLIFTGQIKQFRVGRESATDTYLDILASDGDIGYNQASIATSLRAGSTPLQALQAAASTVDKVRPGSALDTSALLIDAQHTPSIRGQVLFGMSRLVFRRMASHLDAAWSFQDGNIVLTDNTGYREGEVVEVNVATGLIGMPEQTDHGIKFTCLLNSRIRIGNLVHINNDDINQLMQANPMSAPVPFNKRAGLYPLAPLSPDGKFRALVVEHEGDTRGNQWYTHVTGLAYNEAATIDDQTQLPKYTEKN